MPKVIIIDDESTLRFVLKELFIEQGWDVAGLGSDGTEALPLCVEHLPDVVIMDIKMPNMDGIEAATQIKEKCPTPVVLITGVPDEVSSARAAEAGVLAFLTKPVRERDLFAAVELATLRHEEFQNLRKENENLKTTLESRKVVEKAKGLLMEKEGLAESEAYTRIQKTSMDRRLSMKQVAEIIISTFEKGENI